MKIFMYRVKWRYGDRVVQQQCHVENVEAKDALDAHRIVRKLRTVPTEKAKRLVNIVECKQVIAEL